MQEMSIGELARSSGLTVKRLRHYHDIGVLPAARTDPVSGHRFYRPEQVSEAVLLQRLRTSGLPLGEIGEILQHPEDRSERVRAALGRTRSELERARDRVDEVARLLGSLPEVVMAVRRIPDLTVLTASETLSLPECGPWFDQTYPQLYATAGRPSGPPGACYDGSFFETGRGTVTAFLPVTEGTPGARTLPGATFAVAVHDGSYDSFGITYAALGVRVARELTPLPGTDVREHYLIGPSETDEPHRWRSEVCWPVADPSPTQT